MLEASHRIAINKSFNQSVWKLVPKTFFSGLAVLGIGVNIALICFNDGKNYFLKLMSRFGGKPGTAAIKWAKTADE